MIWFSIQYILRITSCTDKGDEDDKYENNSVKILDVYRILKFYETTDKKSLTLIFFKFSLYNI